MFLGVESDATKDEIKQAYKRKSLEMHPDKLAQRGKSITKEDQAKYEQIKEAYKCLSDPHRRVIYDAIGKWGMRWIDEPLSMDPQQLARNFAKASILDRSKVFGIFVAIAIAIFALPVVVCLRIDGAFGNDTLWMKTLFPLWLVNAFLLFYHFRMILISNIQRPDDLPPEEWVDPLPLNQRILSLVRFLLVVLFELLLVLKLDNLLECKWVFVFVPLFVSEATTLYQKWSMVRLRIITIEDLEAAVGKSFGDLTSEEKELIEKLYSVVSSTSSTDFQVAHNLRARARQDMMKSVFLTIFVSALVFRIDTNMDLSWWLVFSPIWILNYLICVANYQVFEEVQLAVSEKDPELFRLSKSENDDEETGIGLTSTDTTIGIGVDVNIGSSTDYGSVGRDGAATQEVASAPCFTSSELSAEEKEKLKELVINSGLTLCTQCCSQVFLLIIFFLIVLKLQGASFSSLWLISPFLVTAGIILFCLGFAIFGISEISDEKVAFDTENVADRLTDNSHLPSVRLTPISLQMSQKKSLHQPNSATERKNGAQILGHVTKSPIESIEVLSKKSDAMQIREID